MRDTFIETWQQRAFSLRLMILTGLVVSLTAAGSYAERPVATGLVLPYLEVTVGSPVQSHVEEHLVREGDLVEKGELLTRLFSRIEQLDMERAKAALEKREFDFVGTENLFRDNLISEDEALASRIERDLARLQYEIAKEGVSLREIRAPIGGVVVERLAEVGESVRSADPVFVIVDIDQVYVQVFVEADQLRHLRQDQEVIVRFPELDISEPKTGLIDFIDPRVDPASGLLRVKILVENPDRRIKVGVRAVTEFVPEVE